MSLLMVRFGAGRNIAKAGVYEIINVTTGDFYIGASKDVCTRMQQHINQLKRNEHICKSMQLDWNKYGEYIFEFNVLEYCNISELESKETKYIKSRKPFYNSKMYINR